MLCCTEGCCLVVIGRAPCSHGRPLHAQLPALGGGWTASCDMVLTLYFCAAGHYVPNLALELLSHRDLWVNAGQPFSAMQSGSISLRAVTTMACMLCASQARCSAHFAAGMVQASMFSSSPLAHHVWVLHGCHKFP